MAANALRATTVTALLWGGGCLDDNPGGDASTDGGSSSGADDGGDDGGDDGPWPTDGMIGCAAGESCTLVFVAETLDDRLDIYAAAGGETYRGAIDLDFKPNPAGDNGGENLDEPYGLALSGGALHALVGHYPAIDNGSLVSFPLDFLAGYDVGTTVPAGDFFDGGAFGGAVAGLTLDAFEPIFVVPHPGGRLLVGGFNNDLFVPPDMWTNPGQIHVVDPQAGTVGSADLIGFDPGGSQTCDGAWNIVAMDGTVDAVTLACDGNEGLAILDTSAVADGSVADAAASITGCVGDVPFPQKHTRAVAPDGAGGALVAEGPPQADGSAARLWWFSPTCELAGAFGELAAGPIWEIRALALLRAEGPYWLMAKARGDDRGVYVIDGSSGTPESCGRIGDLDGAWTAEAGEPIDPHALTLTSAGDAVVIGAGPGTAATAAAGYGKVLWAALDVPDDPCATTATVTDLTASGPPVTTDVPTTWHRAPDVVVIREVEG